MDVCSRRKEKQADKAEIGDRQRNRGQQGGGETRTRAAAERQEETGGSGFTRLDFQAILGVSSGRLTGASDNETRREERDQIFQ